MAGLSIAVLLLASSGVAYVIAERRGPTVFVGSPPRSVRGIGGGGAPEFRVAVPDIGRGPLPEPPSRAGLKEPIGGAVARATAYRGAAPDLESVVAVLLIGSDARPGEDPLRSRADSLHLAVIDGSRRSGVLLGFPRDAWVPIPQHGDGRINEALRLGGPELLAQTVTAFTGIGVDYWVLTDFDGLIAMTDALGGVHHVVDRRMDDALSGARFERGLHHLSGAAALAYTRNRHDTPYADFSRSENQGRIMLSALAKLRSEVRDLRGLRRWLGVLTSNIRTDLPSDELLRLAVLARHVAPERVTNVVVPGRAGWVGPASVVLVNEDAQRLFADVRTWATTGE